jgi:hypothetical protein
MGIFFCKVAYARYDVSWFLEWMDFNSLLEFLPTRAAGA